MTARRPPRAGIRHLLLLLLIIAGAFGLSSLPASPGGLIACENIPDFKNVPGTLSDALFFPDGTLHPATPLAQQSGHRVSQPPAGSGNGPLTAALPVLPAFSRSSLFIRTSRPRHPSRRIVDPQRLALYPTHWFW